MFTAALWNPAEWAAIISECGARYAVFTSKHHDGFANWPTKTSPGWNAGDVGPKRDIVGELMAAMRKVGLYP